jgi:hypothetical protein
MGVALHLELLEKKKGAEAILALSMKRQHVYVRHLKKME